MVLGPCGGALYTHVLIGGLVRADQVGVEPRQAGDGPDGEETHHHLQDGAEQSQRGSDLVQRFCLLKDEVWKCSSFCG